MSNSMGVLFWLLTMILFMKGLVAFFILVSVLLCIRDCQFRVV